MESPIEPKNEEVTPVPLRWLEIVAGVAGIIGMAGLIALMAQNASAAPGPEKGGFSPGERTFTNPFLGNPGAASGDAYYDDEDPAEDFDDVSKPAAVTVARKSSPPPAPAAKVPAPASAQRGTSVSGSGAPGSQATPRAGSQAGAQQGVSLGGSTPGGVITTNNAPPIRINDESAEGSREIVTDFNFPDADIMDIAKALGKLTGKNFILDKDVKGRVTIISNSPITVSDAWKAFLTALDMNGFALIPSGKYVRIARQRDARDKQLRTFTGEYSPDTDALITRLFPLKYLSAEEVARNFRSFMPANSRIIPYEQTNTVIVTDTGSNIAKLSKLLEILDVEGYDAGIEVIPVKYASATELSKLIDTLVPGTAPAGRPGTTRIAPGSRFTARRTKEGGIINTIIADERTNTLIVHANSKGADQIRELIAKLDQRLPASTGGGKVHVVYLQFAEAEQIANTLNNISASATRTAARPTGGTGVNPVQGSLFEGAIRVSPDKATNSLVITASPVDFVTVQRVINKLDIPRDQVYAEVVIMEISLGRDFQFSSNWVSPANGFSLSPSTDLIDFVTNPFSQKGAIISLPFGTTRDVTIGGTTVQVAGIQGLIKALQTRSNANILATPQILALDNTEATFETAERIPVLTTTAVQGAIAQSTTKENVSLSIAIKPQINKIANFVKLDITTKLEDISARELPAQVQNLALATVQRNAKTSIVVANSDTVILGGLVRDNQSEQVSKIPILGDIPLLGWLFSSKRSQVTKTNLLIFITPHIVRQYETVRALLDRKLKERDEFIETSTGGEDPLRKYRDDLIRNLPDMKDITSYQPKKAVSLGENESEPPAAVAVEEGDSPQAPPGQSPPQQEPPQERTQEPVQEPVQEPAQEPTQEPAPQASAEENAPPASTPPSGDQ